MRAIHRAAAEHGVPNSFYYQELHAYHGAPPPRVAGAAARRWLQHPHVTLIHGGVSVDARFVPEPT